MSKARVTYTSARKTLRKRYTLYLLFLVAFTISLGYASHVALSAITEKTFKDHHIKNRIELSERLQHYASTRETMSKEQILYSLVKEIDTFASREKETIHSTLTHTAQLLTPGLVVALLFIGPGSILFTHKLNKKVYQHAPHDDRT